MKKVSGYVSVRALGCYEFEFFVEDNVTDEDIDKMVKDVMEINSHYSVEEGYEQYTEICYRKKNNLIIE